MVDPNVRNFCLLEVTSNREPTKDSSPTPISLCLQEDGEEGEGHAEDNGRGWDEHAIGSTLFTRSGTSSADGLIG
jgi:hypothetical protein